MLLAQIYEKKGDQGQRGEVLQGNIWRVYPHAPDAKKVQAKIAKLTDADERRRARAESPRARDIS